MQYKKNPLIAFCILLLDFWNRNICNMYILFFFLLVSGTNKDIDVYPVLEEQTDVQANNVDNIINVLKKVCVESNVPGLFKCYR